MSARSASRDARDVGFRVASDWVAPVFAYAALFLIVVLVVNPSGNFPLNDDWSFATSTRRLVATGDWRPTGWASMSLITNALWAAPVCRLTACSFDDLRWTTLVASLLLALATALLVWRASRRRIEAFTAAILVCFNPIALPLSFSFMTDVLFAALSTISGLLFIVALERDSRRALAFATLLAIAATLSRQLGLFTPCAFAVVRLLQTDPWPRRVIRALGPVALTTAALLAYDHWLTTTGRAPAAYNLQADQVAQSLKSPIAFAVWAKSNIVTAILYIGLLAGPMVLLTVPPRLRATSAMWARLPSVVAALTVVALVGAMVGGHRMMPFGKNYLNKGGVGLPTLHDGIATMPQLPTAWWLVVTVLSLLGAYGLIHRTMLILMNAVTDGRAGLEKPRARRALFALAAMAIYLAPLMAISPFDRYFIVILPLALMVLSDTAEGTRVGRPHLGLAAGYAAALTLFAVLATHDYMAWNRARWDLIHEIEATRLADPSTLDGGFEYNGLHNFDPAYKPSPDKSDWWVDRDDYMIAFRPAAGFDVVRQKPYRAFLPPFGRSLLLLRRTSPS